MSTATAEATKTTECPVWCQYDTGGGVFGVTHHGFDWADQHELPDLAVVREDPGPDPTDWPGETPIHSIRLRADEYLEPDQARRLAAALIDLADRCEAVQS